MSDSAARVFFRLVHRYAVVNEPDAAPAVQAICDRIGAPELPGLAPEAPQEEQQQQQEEEDGGYGPYSGYGGTAVLPLGAEETTEAADTGLFKHIVDARERQTEERRVKRRVRKGEPEKEAAAWAATLKTFIPENLYEAPLNRFVSALLTPGLKVRTKRSMRFAATLFRRKLEKI
jgi:hypothetical protein